MAYRCINKLITLQWRLNGCDGVSSHQPHDCLLKRLFRRRSKENIHAPRHWPLWPVNSPYNWPVTLQMFSFDDVIMKLINWVFIGSAPKPNHCLNKMLNYVVNWIPRIKGNESLMKAKYVCKENYSKMEFVKSWLFCKIIKLLSIPSDFEHSLGDNFAHGHF